MRIGLIIYDTLETLSGGYLYDRQLVAALTRAGHSVEVISLPNRGYLRHLGDAFSRRLRERLRTSRFDLLLQDELNHPSLAFLNRGLKRHFPIVSIVHHLRSSEEHPARALAAYRWIEQRYLRTVDGFIFNSLSTQASVSALLQKPPTGIVVYPAADHIDPPSREESLVHAENRGARTGPIRLLSVGNVIPRKGLHHILSALHRLPAEHAVLDVVGSLDADPRYVREMRARIRAPALRNRVTLHGAVGAEVLRRHFTEADLFVLPAFEGFGIVYLEAMAFGVPVIASIYGAAGEIVTPGLNGCLVEPADAPALAQTIERFSLDRESILHFGRNARDRYESHPTWQAGMGRATKWLEEFGEMRVQ